MQKTTRKKFITALSALVALVGLAATAATSSVVYADDTGSSSTPGLQISPVSNTVSLIAGETNEYEMEVKNLGDTTLNYKIYPSPYTVSGENSLNFSTENTFTQISRWIMVKDNDGNWVSEATFTIAGGQTKTVTYKISVPEDVPEGGQYATLFAEASNDAVQTSSGVKTVSRVGLLIYGRTTGETVRSSTIYDMAITKGIRLNGSADKTITLTDEFGNEVTTTKKGSVVASAYVANTGNTDYTAKGVFTVSTVFGRTIYTNDTMISVLPENNRLITDAYEESLPLGLYRVSFDVTANDKTKSISGFLCILPLWFLGIVILVIAFIVIWIVISAKKRAERRSQFLS